MCFNLLEPNMFGNRFGGGEGAAPYKATRPLVFLTFFEHILAPFFALKPS